LYIALLNLIIGVFNLLPIKGLDGGTVFYCILCKYTNVNKAELILGAISFLGGLALLLSAVVLTIRGKINISLYIMGIYLLVTTLIKK
jgi:Zn-dependent protease